MLRVASLTGLVAGGLGAVCLMLLSGLHPPLFLVVLFIGWVFAPFAALIAANIIFRRRSGMLTNTISVVSVTITVLSLAIYGYVLYRPMPSQPASPYVAVPLGSWGLMILAIGGAALISRSRRT